MKIITRAIGVAALTGAVAACGVPAVRAADDTATLPAAAVAAPSLAPQADEIKIEGVVQTMDAAAGKLVVLVSTVTLPGKDPIAINPARQKAISVGDATKLIRLDSAADAPALKLTELTVQSKVTAVGKNMGVGKEIPARVLAAPVKAPAAVAATDPGPQAAPVPAGPPPTDDEVKKIRDDVFRGSVDDLTTLLQQKPSLAKGPFPDNDTPVHQAIFWGKPEIVNLFLDHGAPLEVKNRSGQTPLMTAIAWGKADLAQALIDRGANVNTEENDGKTPLGLAREKNMADIVASLEAKHAIEEGPTRGPKAIKWGAPIFEAVQHQDAAKVKELLDQDPKLANARNGQGETPLIANGFWGNMDVATVLLDHGADPNLMNDWGDTVLKKATFFHKDDLVDLLKQHGAK